MHELTKESASHVFERQPDGTYRYTKGYPNIHATVGHTYTREYVTGFARNYTGTLIIEGGDVNMNESATLNQRTITLVTIPKEVAELIGSMRTAEYTSDEIIRCATQDGGVRAYYEILRSIPFDTLLSVLVNGYVIERSAKELAHDKIRDQFTQREGVGAYGNGILFAINTLGIKITEVNA
jgi:hypothetical protein